MQNYYINETPNSEKSAYIWIYHLEKCKIFTMFRDWGLDSQNIVEHS